MIDFFKGTHRNLNQALNVPRLRGFLQALQDAYLAAVNAVPPDRPPLLFGKLLLISHKSFLSAASLIASALPDDSVAITRRAAEAAKVALAIKIDKTNAAKWTSYTERDARWKARLAGRKPVPFRVAFAGLRGDLDIGSLDQFLGVLSDAFVHFTPEYYSSLDWKILPRADGLVDTKLNYFHRSEREIDRQLMQLGAIHGKILKVFDRCYDNALSESDDFRSNFARLTATCQEFGNWYWHRYRQAASDEP